MKLAYSFNALRNTTSYIWCIHDFNYMLPKEAKQDYWERECIDNPMSVYYKF